MKFPFLHNALVLVRFLHFQVVLEPCLFIYCQKYTNEKIELYLDIDERKEKNDDIIIIPFSTLKY